MKSLVNSSVSLLGSRFATKQWNDMLQYREFVFGTEMFSNNIRIKFTRFFEAAQS